MVNRYNRTKSDALYRAKLRLGLKLLTCFVVVYALFVALHIWAADWLARCVAGVSLGLLLGIGLICSTPIMAVVFHLLSCRLERNFAQQLQGSVAAENSDGV